MSAENAEHQYGMVLFFAQFVVKKLQKIMPPQSTGPLSAAPAVKKYGLGLNSVLAVEHRLNNQQSGINGKRVANRNRKPIAKQKIE